MPNILIRNVEESRVNRLNELARQAGISREQFLINLIEETTEDFDPDLVLGYVELKGGELSPSDADCPECGQDLERPHIGFTGNMRPFGPVCFICATTD